MTASRSPGAPGRGVAARGRRRLGEMLNGALGRVGLRLIRVNADGRPRFADDGIGDVVHARVGDQFLLDLIKSQRKRSNAAQAADLADYMSSVTVWQEFLASLDPLDRTLKILQPDSGFRLLDVGCAVGQLVRYLRNGNYPGTYVGIEVVDAFCAHAAQSWSAPGTAFFCGDAAAMPLAAGSVDLVVSRNTLISCYDWRAALAEHCRVARRAIVLMLLPIHRKGTGTCFYLQHSNRHTSLLCAFGRDDFREALPAGADVELRASGGGFEVANLGTVDWHSAVVMLP